MRFLCFTTITYLIARQFQYPQQKLTGGFENIKSSMNVYDTTNCSQGEVDTMAHFHTLILGGLIHMSMCYGDFMSPSQFNNFVFDFFHSKNISTVSHNKHKATVTFFFMGDPLAQRNNTAGCDTQCYNIIINCVLISSNTVNILILILILVSSRSTVR